LGHFLDIIDVSYFSFIMPVITRSRAKASIGSSSGLLQSKNTWTPIGSSDELLESTFAVNSISSNDGFLSKASDTKGSSGGLLHHVLVPSLINNTFDLDTLVSRDCHLLPVQSTSTEVLNLVKSKIEIFEIGHLENTVCDLNHLPHNFAILKLSTMEEDCEEHSSPPKSIPEMMEIGNFLASLSMQMTTHMERLQDQLMMNDKKIAQSQDDFKQEV
jgi:hypothetical protein